MPIEYIKGDMFSSRNPVIAHSVNCKGVFGAGVALQIAQRYPLAKKRYLEKYDREGWKPGEVQLVISNGKIIANMALQDTYGKTGVHTDLVACKRAFSELFDYCFASNRNIAMPKVGSGLGGEAWENVERILIECLEPYPNVSVDVYYL